MADQNAPGNPQGDATTASEHHQGQEDLHEVNIEFPPAFPLELPNYITVQPISENQPIPPVDPPSFYIEMPPAYLDPLLIRPRNPWHHLLPPGMPRPPPPPIPDYLYRYAVPPLRPPPLDPIPMPKPGPIQPRGGVPQLLQLFPPHAPVQQQEQPVQEQQPEPQQVDLSGLRIKREDDDEASGSK